MERTLERMPPLESKTLRPDKVGLQLEHTAPRGPVHSFANQVVPASGAVHAPASPSSRGCGPSESGNDPAQREAQPWVTSIRGYVKSLKRDPLDAALAAGSGQACLAVFAVQTFVFSVIHAGQLFADTRFVNFADSPGPHDSLTFRWVRLIDVVCSMFWGIFMLALVRALSTEAITGARGRELLLGSLAKVSYVYVVGSVIDFFQCHFQAGGIGSHCHGLNCAQIALVLSLTAFVGEYHQHFFCAVCFGGQGLYRFWWCHREERSVLIQTVVSTMSILLLLFPALLHVEEIIHWHVGSSKRQREASACQDDEPKATCRNV